jgi:L-fuculose-phosphate aldolase
VTRDEQALRQAIVDACRWMNASGLNQGTSGNISVRSGKAMLVTPSATPYDSMTSEMIAAMPLAGREETWSGPLKPSSEWRFHRDILASRPEINAVVHTHSVHATALSMTRKPIPPCHYMIGVFGGSDVRVADYATFGTAELSRKALAALDGRTACLLANHGMITLGRDLQQALWRAVELETLARQYILALQAGGPVLLTPAEVEAARAKFGGYGRN